MDLEVTETGSGDALVVFVHGVLGHGRSFDRVAAELESECRMLWYDRRGYSASAAAAGAPVTLSDDERARRRIDAAAFIAEEASVRTGTPPFAVADIQAPVVYGRSDAEVMPIVVDFLRSRMPSMEVVTLPGAGHHAHRTDPEAFAGLVRRGLAVGRA